MMDDLRFPALAEHYDVALRAAVAYIVERFDVLGIIAAGSIIRGTPNATSDFDIYVIHAHPQRQLVHRTFNGVPTQIFVNPAHRIRRYFMDERAEGGCTAAHMLVTGFIVLNRDPVVADLRAEAQAILDGRAEIAPGDLQMARYHAVDQYENALDMAETDVATASMIAHRAVYDMLRYVYLARGEFVPRDKDLLKRLAVSDPQLAALAQTFFTTADPQVRIATLGDIADLTIQTRLFFDMESSLQEV